MKTSLPDTIILAGGLGTRLKSVIHDIPKPMAPIAGKPFLYRLLSYISKFNPSKIVLSTGYLSSNIEQYFGYSFNDIPILYSIEHEPLGTGGAIKKSLNYCNTDNCLILNGDTFFKIDYNELLKFHNSNKSDFTIALKDIEKPERYGTVETNEGNIIAFKEKNKELKNGLINAGIYLLSKSTIKYFPTEEKFSFEKDFLEKNIEKLKIKAWVTDEYFIDIGIPEDLKKANDEFSQIFD